MAKVKLSKGKFALIDEEDLPVVWGHGWEFSDYGYAVAKIDGKKVFMHKLINRTPSGLVTDHINGDKLDNRRCNLRSVTNAQNVASQKLSKRNKTGYKGLHWDKKLNQWRATVRFLNKNYHAGNSSDKKIAAGMYDEKAKRLFGQFAKTNRELGLL